MTLNSEGYRAMDSSHLPLSQESINHLQSIERRRQLAIEVEASIYTDRYEVAQYLGEFWAFNSPYHPIPGEINRLEVYLRAVYLLRKKQAQELITSTQNIVILYDTFTRRILDSGF